MAAPARNEREIITEFIEIYRNLPTLWDIGSDLYKDRDKKNQAWQLLVDKLKEYDPEADMSMAKKKIEHMRTAFKREEKKIKESKKTGSGAKDIHIPNLWYFDLLRPVFNKDEECRPGVDTLENDEDSQSSTQAKKYKERGLELSKRKLIETAQELLKKDDKKVNSFGIYVGEQLEELDTFQRQVAEKLISEVMFLAKTGNLNYNSKIETSYRAPLSFTSNNFNYSPSQSPQYSESSPSPQLLPSPSPQYTFPPSPSPQYNVSPSPTPQYTVPPSALPQHTVLPSPLPQHTVPPSPSPSLQNTIPPSPSPHYTVQPSPPRQNIKSLTAPRLVISSNKLIRSTSLSPRYILQSLTSQYSRSSSSPSPSNIKYRNTPSTQSTQFISPTNTYKSQTSATEQNENVEISIKQDHNYNINKENLQFTSNTAPTEENQEQTVQEGCASSLLREFLIVKKK